MIAYGQAFVGIVWREILRFIHQRERFLAALVRPLVWLIVFAAGFRAVLGISIIAPYETYITYDVYIVPGLIGMIQLFNGMQSSLSMVYDREMGSMRVLLTTPLPRWFLLVEEWADRHRDAMLAFVKASRQAKELLAASDAEWDRLRPQMNVEDDTVFSNLVKRYREGIPSRPMAEEERDTAKVYEKLADIGGEKLVGPARTLAPGTFWSALTQGS